METAAIRQKIAHIHICSTCLFRHLNSPALHSLSEGALFILPCWKYVASLSVALQRTLRAGNWRTRSRRQPSQIHRTQLVFMVWPTHGLYKLNWKLYQLKIYQHKFNNKSIQNSSNRIENCSNWFKLVQNAARRVQLRISAVVHRYFLPRCPTRWCQENGINAGVMLKFIARQPLLTNSAWRPSSKFREEVRALLARKKTIASPSPELLSRRNNLSMLGRKSCSFNTSYSQTLFSY